jgi:serine/threonine-protein kinase HipA
LSAPTPVCLICLSPEPPDEGGHHRACIERLFDAPALPRMDFERATIIAWPRRRGVKMSISGAQPKASLRLSVDRSALFPTDHDGTYLVKPELVSYRGAPENEHLTMCLARLVGLRVAECGLFQLKDGTFAYVTRRFDRIGTPIRKLRFEDFCQLSGRPSAAKGSGTAEECASLALRHAGPEGALELFRLFLFSYWAGNGDLHLKNVALLEENGGFCLSPAYDLLCTHLYGDTSMTLSVGARSRDIPRLTWLEFAVRHCALERTAAKNVIDGMLRLHHAATVMIDRSVLPTSQMKRRYQWLLGKRSRALRH